MPEAVYFGTSFEYTWVVCRVSTARGRLSAFVGVDV